MRQLHRTALVTLVLAMTLFGPQLAQASTITVTGDGVSDVSNQLTFRTRRDANGIANDAGIRWQGDVTVSGDADFTLYLRVDSLTSTTQETRYYLFPATTDTSPDGSFAAGSWVINTGGLRENTDYGGTLVAAYSGSTALFEVTNFRITAIQDTCGASACDREVASPILQSPQYTVSSVPLPAAGWLLVSGIGALLGLRRT